MCGQGLKISAHSPTQTSTCIYCTVQLTSQPAKYSRATSQRWLCSRELSTIRLWRSATNLIAAIKFKFRTIELPRLDRKVNFLPNYSFWVPCMSTPGFLHYWFVDSCLKYHCPWLVLVALLYFAGWLDLSSCTVYIVHVDVCMCACVCVSGRRFSVSQMCPLIIITSHNWPGLPDFLRETLKNMARPGYEAQYQKQPIQM